MLEKFFKTPNTQMATKTKCMLKHCTLDDGKKTLFKFSGQLCTLTWWWSHACCSRSASQRGGGGGGGLAHDLGGQWIFPNEQRCEVENPWYSLHILGMDWLLHLSDDTLMGKF